MNPPNDEPAGALDDTSAATDPEDAVGTREFLDFLISAYRCDDALRRASDAAERDATDDDRVDWTVLSRDDLFRRLSAEDHRAAGAERARRVLGRKLKDVVNEGVLDSVLPFIVQKKSPIAPKTAAGSSGRVGGQSNGREKGCGGAKPKCVGNHDMHAAARSKGE